jgi:RNA polymerase sigma-70 factor (ECF subfamily)
MRRLETSVSFDREALPLLDRLYGAAVRFTRSPASAEDLVLETYLQAYAAFGSLQPGTNLRVWMYRILTACYLDAVRRAQGTPTPEEIGDRNDSTGFRPTEVEALDRLPAGDVKAVLEELPAGLRIAVYLADVEGFTYQEIADITGTALDTVISQLHRGRRRLRELLRDSTVKFTE